MLKKALLAAALTMVSGVALARPPHWAPAHGYRGHHYQPHVRYYPVAPRVVYRPVPVYPVAVRPAPVIVRPAPVIIPAPAIVFRLRFPL